MTTDKRLIEAAAELLDAGGEEAVTLRAVGHAAGVSHNAPYKHFANRSALLAAVATVSFADLAEAMAAIRRSAQTPIDKLFATLDLLMGYSREHPARYRLLFNNPETAAAGGDLKVKALETFEHFRSIVQECQEANDLPGAPSGTLASLIFATTHGLLAIEGNGQLHPEKGLSSVKGSLEILLALLAPPKA
ncbi:TetR/AcrR family transcriptional regulator [Rhizobium leguminosarum]|uniref:TetR/AcrR family transcriptional regulator n=1 Tax=Rhizobium leguminosarum TaxID=384 RepID=UPI00103DB947|nr:TetR/AcrR family transcriptional regulator [Rhizobium leguminosarum]TBZ19301.1 TetR/AcrR family transcriptional regulator [Rhizobium leguminosarum bv. viciae]